MDEKSTGDGVEVLADAPPIYQAPVLETEAPIKGGREVDAGAQVGGSNPGTPEGDVSEGMRPGWDMFKDLFLRNTLNGFNSLSRLTMQ